MPSLTPRYRTSSRPRLTVLPTAHGASTASATPASDISVRNSCVMGAPPKRSQWTCPPANKISWNMSAPGRLVHSIPNAMGRSSSGSKPFTMARYSRTKEMAIMMRHFQLPS